MLLWVGIGSLMAQVLETENQRLDSKGRPLGAASKMTGGDSLQRRDDLADSITIYYRMFDSSRTQSIDSSVSDFYSRFSLPPDYLYLGSLGSASRSLIFKPNMQAGFDAGFHAYDAYQFNLANTKLYQTTRPYTELDYILGSRSEQTIKVMTTQNISPSWNVLFDYRFVNQAGQFKNNNTSHSNIRLASAFATRNKRYSGTFVFILNRNKASENGGIQSDSFLTSTNAAYNDRFNIPTNLGGDGDYSSNFFASAINTGTQYASRHTYFQHQYDFGQKDSVLNEADSSYKKYFYPRLRLQHTMQYRSHEYSYTDKNAGSYITDSTYANRYGFIPVITPIFFKDKWQDFNNDFALILFPEKENQAQFLKVGAGIQLLTGTLGTAVESFTNTSVLGEYRFRTKNRKWEVNADARLYLSGEYSGNYTAGGYVQSNLSKLGALQLRFRNTNRTPSFVYDSRSSFVAIGPSSLKQENYTSFGGTLWINKLGLKLQGDYTLMNNYTYWKSYTEVDQASAIISLLQLQAQKRIKLSNRWNWYVDLAFQPETSDILNLPLAYVRNRIAYEGQFFTNLSLSTGAEIRYFSNFKADDYAPFNGQWVTQNTTTISNRPDIAAFLHIRVKSFRAFLRVENLNTLDFSRGIGFLAYNHAAPLYATPGMVTRLGIYWTFVN